jgi:hypothetical protein
MKKNQLFRMAVVAVLWLCIGAGCNKDSDPTDPTECGPGCCFPNSSTRFAARLDGVLLRSAGEWYIFLEKDFYDVALLDRSDVEDREKKSNFLTICEVQKDYWKSLRTNLNRDKKYKVWGTVYVDIMTFTYVAFPMPYSVKIDRIEEVQ